MTTSADPRDPLPDAPGSVPGGPALLAEVAALLHEVVGLDPAVVRAHQRFVADLRVDSLAMVEVLEGCRLRLGVPVADAAASQLVHVGDLLDYLVVHRG